MHPFVGPSFPDIRSPGAFLDAAHDGFPPAAYLHEFHPDIRRRLNTHGAGLSPVHEAIFRHVRERVDFFETDREIWPDIRAVEAMVRSGELLDLAEDILPELE